MSGDRENRTSSDLGGAPGGMGGSTGADPRGPAAGERSPAGGEPRSFAPTEPGRTPPEGEGGGVMSGRGQEHGPDAAGSPGTGVPGQGGDHLMGRSGGQEMAEREGVGEMRQDLGEDSGALSGTGSQGAAAAGGGRGTSGGARGGGPAEAEASDMADTLGGMSGDPAEGENTTSGTGANSQGGTGAAAGGDAHLGHDGRRLGDPMNARRQVPSDGSTGGINGGSGAD